MRNENDDNNLLWNTKTFVRPPVSFSNGLVLKVLRRQNDWDWAVHANIAKQKYIIESHGVSIEKIGKFGGGHSHAYIQQQQQWKLNVVRAADCYQTFIITPPPNHHHQHIPR